MYKLNQNEVTERAIQTTENSIRAIFKNACLLLKFWNKIILTDVYLRNRIITGLLIEKLQVISEKSYLKIKSTVDYIRIWGIKYYFYINLRFLYAETRHNKLINKDFFYKLFKTNNEIIPNLCTGPWIRY